MRFPCRGSVQPVAVFLCQHDILALWQLTGGSCACCVCIILPKEDSLQAVAALLCPCPIGALSNWDTSRGELRFPVHMAMFDWGTLQAFNALLMSE